MKYIKKEKTEYESFHLRCPSDIFSAIRGLASESDVSLNSEVIELLELGIEAKKEGKTNGNNSKISGSTGNGTSGSRK